MEYFSFISCVALISYLTLFIKDNNNSLLVFFYCLAIIVGLLIGFRGMEDELTRLYIRFPALFEITNDNFSVFFERGLITGILSSLFQQVGLSSQEFLLLFGLSSLMIHAIYYKKFTPFFFVAFVVYLSHEVIFKEFHQVRAGLASALVLPAIYYLCSNRIKIYFYVVLLAGLVHYVGFILFLLFFVRKRIQLSYMLVILLISLIFSQLGVFKEIIFYLANIGLLPEFINIYMTGEYLYDIGLNHPKIIQQLVVLFLALVLLIRYGSSNLPPYHNIIINTYFLSSILFILFSDMVILATRFSAMLNSVEPILLVNLAYYFKEKRIYLTLLIISALLLSYGNYVVRQKLEPYEMFLPYNTSSNIYELRLINDDNSLDWSVITKEGLPTSFRECKKDGITLIGDC